MKTIGLTGLALGLSLVSGVALAQTVGAPPSSVGAPNSASGGINPAPLIPPSHPLPPALGPQSGSGVGGSSSGGVRDLTPGTGKFETHGAPCIGGTGFGSSGVQPGHRC